MPPEGVLIAFSFTLFAGLATGIGSLMAFVAKPTNTRFLAVSLGFSAGVMIYVSFVEIFRKAVISLSAATDAVTAQYLTTLGFFLGILLIALIDKIKLSPKEDIHAIRLAEEMDSAQTVRQKRLHKMGVFTALSIAIHNFPEGLATFLAALENPQVGLAIAAAIAIHNIPEGIAVAIPIYHSTGSRARAFWYSFASGLSEPVGALLGYFLVLRYMGDLAFGMVFAGVAGIMVYISLDQLLPTAQKYGDHHLSIYGLVSGMVVMAVSLLLFL